MVAAGLQPYEGGRSEKRLQSNRGGGYVPGISLPSENHSVLAMMLVTFALVFPVPVCHRGGQAYTGRCRTSSPSRRRWAGVKETVQPTCLCSDYIVSVRQNHIYHANHPDVSLFAAGDNCGAPVPRNRHGCPLWALWRG